MIDCMILDRPLDIAAAIAAAADPGSGATSIFIGTARNSSPAQPGGEVIRLEYEAYGPMAEREMRAIARECVELHGITGAIVHHRVGQLPIGDAAVVVVVAAAHRAGAFDGCRFIIEELKKRVPIWKKEVFHDGAEWVNARP